MLDGVLARRYAQALFELAVEMAVLDQINGELRELSQLIAGNQELKYLLNHPNIEGETKKELLGKIVADQVSDLSMHFLYLLIDRRRQNLLSLIQRQFSQLTNSAQNIVEAKVTSAAVLSAAQEEKMRQLIAQCTGKNVLLLAEVDPDLIGGVKLQIGDRVMDGSIATALCKMRDELRKSSDKPQQEVGVK